MNNNLNEFFKALNIKPKNLPLYERAFTHSSFNFDAKTDHKDYERLEFIGDSVIGFVVADLAYTLHPELSQGEMTKLRSTLVQSQNLNRLAKNYHMERYIKVGNSLRNQDLSKMTHLLEDVFEAVVGAMYIDQGLKTTYGIVKKIFYPEVKNFNFSMLHDYKSQLQEEIQAENREAVEYVVVKESGPSHDKVFEVEVRLENLTLGKGVGKSKKEAEQSAAKDALSKRVK